MLFRPALILAAAASCLAATPAGAEGLNLSGSTRIRGEWLSGEYRPAMPDSDQFISFRTDLLAELDLGAVKLVGEVIDARGYAENRVTPVRTLEINAIEPVQAYAAIRTGAGGTVTLGKFTMDIGSSRLVGRTDFPNGVPSYGGAMFDWRDASHRLRLFWTHPFTALPDDMQGIRDNRVELDRMANNIAFFGGSATFDRAPGGASLELYAYRLAEHDRTLRPTRGRRLVTLGGRLRRAPAANLIDYEVEGAWQGGSTRLSAAPGPRVPVRAGFFHAEAGWTSGAGWRPRASAMFDYASGDGGDSTSYGRFDALYGARRLDFGPLSLFGPIGRANVLSPGIRLEAAPSKRLDLMAAVRPTWLARATDSFALTGLRDPAGRSGRYGGTQTEVRARRWLVPGKLRLELVGAWLAKGGFLRRAPGAPDNGDTHYLLTEASYSF
ncbi:MAG: alginate export family protein [Sphingomonas bacterium]